MSGHTEASLKALTVPKLKDILTAKSLPVTGKKEDLISRILAASSDDKKADFDPLAPPPDEFDWEKDESVPSTSEAPAPGAAASEPAPITAPAPSDAPVPAAAAEEPKTASAPSTSEAAPAATEPTPTPVEASTSTDATPAPSTSNPAPVASASTSTTESKPASTSTSTTPSEASIAADIEKKKQRAARFGVPYVEKATPTLPKPRKAVLPPTSKSAANPSKPTAKPAAAAKSASTPIAATTLPVVPKAVDPIEEEKKRKRAEKFGTVSTPAEKKAKA